MTAAELAGWTTAALEVPGELPARPCIDCPRAWARRQRSEGRCNGMPGDTTRTARPTAVAEPTSSRILRVLDAPGLAPAAVAAGLGLSMASARHHLAHLAATGQATRSLGSHAARGGSRPWIYTRAETT